MKYFSEDDIDGYFSEEDRAPKNKGKGEVFIMPPESKREAVNFLENHTVGEDHRARMVDWMIQVYNVLRVSLPKTFFLGASIMDYYFACK